MKFVALKEAFETVLDLARQNVIDERDNKEENERQNNCIELIEEIRDWLKKEHPNLFKIE